MSGSGTWEADDGEEMQVLGEASGSATWHTTSSSSANQITLTVQSCVTGDVIIERGRFQWEASFCTTGDLELGETGTSNASEVAVESGETATFGLGAGNPCSCS